MPAKYFPSLSPNGIDYNTMPNLGDMAQAPRGQDPMHYGFKGSKGPQSPFAPMVGQAADALMDPRLGMLPMVGGFRVAGGAAQRALSTAKTFGTESGVMMDQQAAQLGSRARRGAEILEREPLPYQQATTVRQPQGDQSMGKAITDLAASMGWSSEKMADWLVQNGFRSGTKALPPVAPQMRRVYRGETTQRVDVPDWISEGLEQSGAKAAEGRWWTHSKDIADWYVKDAHPHGRMLYQDIPEDVFNRSRVNQLPSDIRKFSRDPENELFLPSEFRGKGKPIE